MTRKSSTETLIAAMRVLARDIQSGDGVANAAIAEAADRLAEQQSRIAELERSVEWWQSCTKDCGDVINDGIGTRQQLRAECDRLRAKVSEPEQANNRAILDSSDHVPDATKMVTDRQLADAVNDLRKFHAAGQLRERIAGVVRGLVRGEPATVDVAYVMARDHETGNAWVVFSGSAADAATELSRRQDAGDDAWLVPAARRLLAGGGK